MPTWDEIAPETDRWTRSSRLTCTNVLLGLNIAGFAISGLLPGLFGVSVDAAAFDARRAIGSFWIWQFVTHTFVHPIDFFYLFWFIVGAYMLFLYGNELERDLGRARYLSIYFGCAAYGAMMHAVYQYVGGSAMKASSFFGPAFAMMTTCAWRTPSRPVLFFFIIPMRLRTSVLISAVVVFFYCLVYLKSGLSPIAVLGAGIAAIAVHYVEPALDRWMDGRETRRSRSRLVEGVELRHRVDQILEKISREGMGALTRTERRLLKRASDSMGRDRDHPND